MSRELSPIQRWLMGLVEQGIVPVKGKARAGRDCMIPDCEAELGPGPDYICKGHSLLKARDPKKFWQLYRDRGGE